MAWFPKSKNLDETDAGHHPAEPEILSVEDGEEGAEVVYRYTEPASTAATTTITTPRKRIRDLFSSASSPNKTLPIADDEDDEEEQPVDSEEQQPDADTASSVSFSKDLEQYLNIRKQALFRKIAILACVILIFLAITLGIALGKKKQTATVVTQNSSQGNAPETSPPTNVVASNTCTSAAQRMSEGSSSIGVISSATTNSFVNGAGQCGNAAYGVGPGRWYYTPGNGSSMELVACSQNCTVPKSALLIPEVSIFTGDCSALLCVNGTSNLLTDGPLRFQSIRGQEFYIFIQGGHNTLGLFEISLTAAS